MEGLLGNPVIQGLLGGAGPMGVRAQSQQQMAAMTPRSAGGMLGAPSAPAPDQSGAAAIASLGNSVAQGIQGYAAKQEQEANAEAETKMLTEWRSTLSPEMQKKTEPYMGSPGGRKVLMGFAAKAFDNQELTTSNTALFDVDGKPKRLSISEGVNQGLPEWKDAPDIKTFGNDVVGYYTIERGADGKPKKTQLVGGMGRTPPATPAPQTVRTAEGVFILNRDGTLGNKLGDAEARPQDDLAAFNLSEKQRFQQTQGVNNYEDISKTIRQAETVLNHPGREAGTGMSSWRSMVPGSEARGFAAQLETLKSQVFLPEVQKMQGMGSLSNAEGAKISAAFAALDADMPEDEFQSTLQRAIGDLRRAQERARARLPEDYADPFGGGNAQELNVLIDKYAGEQ